MIIGNRNVFAFDIGPQNSESELRTVDVVIGNRHVCCDDNTVFVPQFIGSLQHDASRILTNDWDKYKAYFENKNVNEVHQFILRTRTEGTAEYNLEDDNIFPLYNFLNWGPTTDNLFSFIVPVNNEYYLTYQFCRPEHSIKSEIGKIYNVRITLEEIVKAIEETIIVLKE